MNQTTITIITAILASNALFAFLQFLFDRHDTKKNIKGTLIKLEKDGLRTQLLLLILMQPDEQTEILTLGERYFRKPPFGLDGNWYMTGIFSKWCSQRKLNPDWFQDRK